jgi:hypothetical protein
MWCQVRCSVSVGVAMCGVPPLAQSAHGAAPYKWHS